MPADLKKPAGLSRLPQEGRERCTIHYGEDDLSRMLCDLESDLVERKRSAADRSAIRRNICASANDLGGRGQPGVILIGVEDDGRSASLPITDQLLPELAQMRDDGNILPLPSMLV